MLLRRRRSLMSDSFYTVKFASYDGSTIYSSAIYDFGEAVSLPINDLTRANNVSGGTTAIYTFIGWSTSQNATSGTMDIPPATENVTYYAAYSVSYKYLVQFKSFNGNTTYSSAWYSPGATVTKPANSSVTTPANVYNSSTWNETVYSSFAGAWATATGATSGSTAAITATNAPKTYYAAFSVAYTRLYVIKDSAFNPNYTHDYTSTSGSCNAWTSACVFKGIGGGYHTYRIKNIPLNKYTKWVTAGSVLGSASGFAVMGIGTNTVSFNGSLSGNINAKQLNSPSDLNASQTYSTTTTSGAFYIAVTYTSYGQFTSVYFEKAGA